MSSVDVFHKIFVAGAELEQPTMNVLRTWYPTFLRQIEEQLGLTIGELEAPKERNYTSRNTYSDLPGEELPKVIVISPGLVGTPQMSGSGQYRATWRLGVGVAVSADTEELAKFRCDIYGAAARDIMLKKGSGALNAYVNFVDEQYAGIPLGNTIQQYRAASLWFTVDVNNVATKRGGPDLPDRDPYEYHTAQTVDTELIKEPING